MRPPVPAMLCLLQDLCDCVCHQRCCCAQAGPKHAAPQRNGTAGRQAAVLACMHACISHAAPSMGETIWDEGRGAKLVRHLGLRAMLRMLPGACCCCCHSPRWHMQLLPLHPAGSAVWPLYAPPRLLLWCCMRCSAACTAPLHAPQLLPARLLHHSSLKLLLHAPASTKLPPSAPSLLLLPPTPSDSPLPMPPAPQDPSRCSASPPSCRS